jgi:hypothetical protein
MFSSPRGLGSERKISYSFVGLLVGDIVMLIVFSIMTQAWQQSSSHVLAIFPFCVSCSLFGWVAIGIPAVLFTNTDFVAGLKWPSTVFFGVLLGLAVLGIIVIIYGRLPVPGKDGFFYCWGFSALVASIASIVYAALARRGLRIQSEEDKPLNPPEPPAFSLNDYIRLPQDEAEPSDQK